jgi:hypothetical protein
MKIPDRCLVQARSLEPGMEGSDALNANAVLQGRRHGDVWPIDDGILIGVGRPSENRRQSNYCEAPKALPSATLPIEPYFLNSLP